MPKRTRVKKSFRASFIEALVVGFIVAATRLIEPNLSWGDALMIDLPVTLMIGAVVALFLRLYRDA